jgi:phosphoserine phosphatase RsbU/P
MQATTVERDPHTMRCLEVWGGNQAVDNGVVMAGLDAWLYSRPFEDQSAGGDIHFVSSCAAGLVTRVLVADVSGHGEAVAEAAGALRGLMRRYVNYVDQSRLVQGLNVEFGAISEAGGFATAVVATYDATADELTLCNAGHPRPLWYRARGRTWQLMSQSGPEQTQAGPSNTPLGVLEPACYNKTIAKLATGDLVLMYTDSLIEARSPDGSILGENGLLRLVEGLDPSEPRELLRALLEAVAAHRGDAASGDDVTVLILRPNGLKPRVSVRVHVVSTARMVSALLASIRPRGPEFPAPESGPLAWLGGLVNRRHRRCVKSGGTSLHGPADSRFH